MTYAIKFTCQKNVNANITIYYSQPLLPQRKVKTAIISGDFIIFTAHVLYYSIHFIVIIVKISGEWQQVLKNQSSIL